MGVGWVSDRVACTGRLLVWPMAMGVRGGSNFHFTPHNTHIHTSSKACIKLEGECL